MSRNRIFVAVFAAALAALLIWFLEPCGKATTPEEASQGGFLPSLKTKLKKKPAEPKPATEPAPAPVAPPSGPAAAVEQIDNTPPVNLTESEEVPNVAKCVIRNFPAEAKPYVRTATVTVRLNVDKFGKVREVKPTAVEFGQEVEEDLQPRMRKLFIEAGRRAFGSKPCPPHVVNGQSAGYVIIVPLLYTH
jgi:hypothetical protein